MTKVKKRLLMILITTLIITIGSVVLVYAAPAAKFTKVDAYQGVKIVYNGNELTGANQPYIINNVTYVPLRLVMENFGKIVGWDAVNYKVIIQDNSSSNTVQLSNQIAALTNENAALKKQITALQAQVNEEDSSTSDIKEALEDEFDDAGDGYFDDEGIEFTFSVSGNKDALAYTIKMDFDDADEYDGLEDVSDSDIEDFLDDVEATINDEIDGTDFEDAKITGKLIDNDSSSDYVKFNGSSYTYSWDDDEDDTTAEDIEDAVTSYTYFKNAGDKYFDDEDVDVNISLDVDEDEISYDVEIDCSNSSYDDISDIGKTDVKVFLAALKSKITSEIQDTDFEDADIVGHCEDADDSTLSVDYEDGTYDWGSGW